MRVAKGEVSATDALSTGERLYAALAANNAELLEQSGYLTACIASAWKRDVYITGVTLPMKEIARIAHGETLLGWQGEGIWFTGGRRWRPEDMALKPEVFLDGVDPEQDNYGIKSGLHLWLDLAKQGFMDTGMGADFCVKANQLFQQELKKYSENAEQVRSP